MAMLRSSPWQIHYHLWFSFKCEMRWCDGKHNKSEICNGSYSSVILRSCLASRVVLAPVALCNCALRRGGGNTGCFHSGPYPMRFKENSPVVMAAAAVVSACQACRSPDDEQSSDWCFPANLQTQSRHPLVHFQHPILPLVAFSLSLMPCSSMTLY